MHLATPPNPWLCKDRVFLAQGNSDHGDLRSAPDVVRTNTTLNDFIVRLLNNKSVTASISRNHLQIKANECVWSLTSSDLGDWIVVLCFSTKNLPSPPVRPIQTCGFGHGGDVGDDDGNNGDDNDIDRDDGDEGDKDSES